MKDREKLDLSVEDLSKLLARVQGAVDPSDYEMLQALIRTFVELVQALDAKKTSIGKLRALIFGSKTEKTRDTGGKGDSSDGKAGRKKKKKKKRKGHGRNGVDAYPGAEKIPVPHETIKAGQSCPHCPKGKVYRLVEDGKELRIVGQPALKASIYELERWRCNLCGEVFTAKLPKEAGTKKYDATAGSIIAALKYGSGFPFYRLDKFQEALGVPLPASVQWEIVDDMGQKLLPAFQELSREAAQGKVLHNDDTGAKILGLGGDAEEDTNADSVSKDQKSKKKRTGTFTSAIVSTGSGKQIALFFTGRKHAGENLKDVLSQRASDLPPPIQMCDALERNLPGELKTIVGNCLAHGRRKFFEVATSFPEECRHVLDELAEIYRIDALAKEKVLTDEDRLELHKENSAPVMKRLNSWLKAQINEKKTEPNSGLGKAINYLLKRWKRFTLFLRRPGAPLDNNTAERVLKMAILHRKNAYFYKTERGAAVGDLFMSLIQTCRLNKINPFKYLTALQENAERLREKPADWLPWNYEAALPEPAVEDSG